MIITLFEAPVKYLIQVQTKASGSQITPLIKYSVANNLSSF